MEQTASCARSPVDAVAKKAHKNNALRRSIVPIFEPLSLEHADLL
jgi:hypothetical protein